MVRALGHVGAWEGLYASAAFICLTQLAGLTGPLELPRPEAIAMVFLIACGVYALDRVKLRDSWIDPADEAAQPRRYAFLRAHSRRVRGAAIVMLVSAALVGLRISPWAPAVAALAATSVVAYAMRPRGERPRIKDIVWIKNGYVAAGMCGFLVLMGAWSGGVTSLGWDQAAGHAGRLVVAGGILAVRIALDAAMCDIDDEPTDRAFRTDTLSTALGGSSVWVWAGVARLGLIVALVLAWPLPWRARIVWGGAMLLGTGALRIPRWDGVRMAVDLRFMPEAIATTACLNIWHAVG